MNNEMQITDEQLDDIGKIADGCDNCLQMAKSPLPASIHLIGLTAQLKSVRDELRKIYKDIEETKSGA